MIILGIETSGRAGSVALCDGDRTLASYAFPEGRRRARSIVSAVDSVIAEAGTGKAGVSAVAVSQGPGSFTGLRVGVTCAKALAYALGWKCAGVPSLEALAWNAPPPAGGDGWACPVLDARRERVNGMLFRWRDGWRDTTGLLCVEPAELAGAIPEGALVFGSGVRAYPDVFVPERYKIGGAALEVGRADVVARLGLERIRAGRDVDPMALVPRYYRPTAPEEKLGAGATGG